MKIPQEALSRILAILIAFVALAAPAAAQQEAAEGNGAGEPEIDDLFIDRVDVNIVNVDVYVTDKKGNRVNGLTRDDFEILEDGGPVKISNFYAVEEGRPTDESAPAAAASSEREPQLSLRPQAPVVPEDQRLHLILYFDNLFLKPFNRNKVVRQVRQFLHRNITEGDRVMLVTFDRSIHVRQEFTSDMRAIGEALGDIETLSAFAVQGNSERRDVIRRFEGAATSLEAEAHIDLYAKSLHFDVTTTIRYLKDMVGSLAGLPGRKAILHVSDGIPMTAAEDLFFMLNDRWQDESAGATLRSNQYSSRRLFRELTASANTNRVTFYTIEAAGLRAHTSLSAEYGGGRDREGLGSGSRAEADFIRSASMQESLMMMAHDTGGLATISTNNFDGALTHMANDFRTYYSLGYEPSHNGDGRYHDIEVKVKRKGLKLRHRNGYRDKTVETQLSEGTLAALLYGFETNPMKVELRFSPARPGDESGRYLLPIEVRVPLGNATLIPKTEVYQGQLRFSVAVIDDQGRMSPVEQTPVPLAIPLAQIEAARGQYYVYTVELKMRRGQQKVAVGVRDELAAESSYIQRRVRVGSRS